MLLNYFCLFLITTKIKKDSNSKQRNTEVDCTLRKKRGGSKEDKQGDTEVGQ